MEQGIWKWAAAAGMLGLLLMVGAILMAERWENMFGVAVLLGMVCIGVALLLLAIAWVQELWRSLRQKAYVQTLFWLVAGIAALLPAWLRIRS